MSFNSKVLVIFMSIQETGLGIDSNRLMGRTFAILENRDRYFLDLVNQIKKRYPGLKIIYANNTMGQQLDPSRPNPDFIIIMKGQLVSKDPRLPPKSIIIMDAPMIFSDRSLAGWTIAVEEGNIEGYFAYMFDKALRLDEGRFYEFIQHMALLSLKPDDPLYWKRIENTDALVKDLEELYARYTKRNARRIDDKRGFTGKK